MRIGTLKHRVARLCPSKKRHDMFCSYEALQDRHIRLLTLLPGSGEEIICCLLDNRSLDNTGSNFEALSWAWGTCAKLERTVKVNGQKHSIRKALAEAMQTLRRPEEPRLLWVDAICIDQSNFNEKAKQVPLMAEIYTRATSIIIWLGDSTHEIDWAVECIEKRQTNTFKTASFHATASDIKTRPWFSRVWVIQEFALTKSDPILLFRNGKELLWTPFLEAYSTAIDWHGGAYYANCLNNNQIDSATLKDVNKGEDELTGFRWTRYARMAPKTQKAYDNSIEHIRNRQQKFGDLWMVDCLLGSCTSRSTDAKDRIYGILGLLLPQRRELFLREFPIDYSKHLGEVYTDAAIYILTSEKERSLEVYQKFNVNAGNKLSVPSWVPDFSDPHTSKSNYLSALKADGVRLSSPVHITRDRQRLSLKGIFLDELTEFLSCGKPFEETHTYRLPSVLLLLKLTIFFSCSKYGTWQYAFQMAENGAQASYHVWLLSEHIADIKRLIEIALGMPLSDQVLEFLVGPNPDHLFQTDEEIRQEFDRVLELGSHSKARINEAFEAKSLGAKMLVIMLQRALGGQSFFVGKNGHNGLTRGQLQKGDRLVLLAFPQQHAPFILRKKSEVTFEMVGMAELPEVTNKAAWTQAGEGLVDIQIV